MGLQFCLGAIRRDLAACMEDVSPSLPCRRSSRIPTFSAIESSSICHRPYQYTCGLSEPSTKVWRSDVLVPVLTLNASRFSAAVIMSIVYDYEIEPKHDHMVEPFEQGSALAMEDLTPERASIVEILPFGFCVLSSMESFTDEPSQFSACLHGSRS